MASTALAHAPAHLVQKGRHELIRHVMNIKNGMAKHKAAAKHGLMTVACGAVASTAGALAGLAAVKMPHLPKTKVRTDLALGALVGTATALGLFDEAAQLAGAFAHGLLGYGTGDAVKQKLLASGMKQAA
jgi:hypothetical protein